MSEENRINFSSYLSLRRLLYEEKTAYGPRLNQGSFWSWLSKAFDEDADIHWEGMTDLSFRQTLNTMFYALVVYTAERKKAVFNWMIFSCLTKSICRLITTVHTYYIPRIHKLLIVQKPLPVPLARSKREI